MTIYQQLKNELEPQNVTLVVVSKTRTNEEVMAIYNQGHRIFGENRVQELVKKHEELPQDIQWHLIGSLQRNKIKYIAPFVQMIHSVESEELLVEIAKQAVKVDREIDVLLQIKVAQEETKHGWNGQELWDYLQNSSWSALTGVRIRGLMGMASLTEDEAQVKREFEELASWHHRIKERFFAENPAFDTLSMGMSGDYKLAVSTGSNMVRIGSMIFAS